MKGLDPTIKTQIQAVLQKCPPFESDPTLKAIFIDARLHPWQARLPQATNTADRVDGAMAFLWQQYHAAFMANGLVLFLQVLADQFDDNDKLHIDLHALATQLAVTIEPPRIINLPTSQTSALADCPYRSLFAFRPEHAPIFFGRESFTQQLVTTIQRQPFTALLGASGSGKSSVVMAGLVPALNGTQDKWLFSHFRPADNPFLGLAHALVPLLEPAISSIKQLSEAADLAAHLRQGKFPLRHVLQRIAAMRPDHRLLLIADQFEELYTTAKAEREPFMDLLIAAVQNPLPNFRLVTTMRADFLEQASRYRPFADTLQHQTILLGPMTREEMSLAIEQPALMQGVSFEPHLLKDILDDVGEAEGNLPLLEFALSELWRLQDDGLLTHVAYKQIGQVKGALSRHADVVFKKLTEDEQKQARHIFVNHLVTLGLGQGAEDTRRVAPQADLAEDWPLVTKLATERLVVTNEHEKIQTAEVVHEALIRHWGRLREWLAADREFLVWRQRLRDDLKQWLDTNGSDRALLQGVSLDIAQDWLNKRVNDLNQIERRYIQKSLEDRERLYQLEQQQLAKERQQSQTIRRVAQGLSVALVGLFMALLVTGGLAWYAREQQTIAVVARGTAEAEKTNAENQKATAEASANIAQIRLLLAQGKEVYEEKPLLGIRLALESEAIAPPNLTNEVTSTLHQLLGMGRVVKLGQDVTWIYTTPLPHTILINYVTQSSTLRNLSTGQVSTLSGQVEYNNNIFYSPENNGDFVVDYRDVPGELRLGHGQQVITLSGQVNGVNYSPENNGDFVVNYTDAPGELRLGYGQQVITLSGQVDWVDYSPENNGDFVVWYDDKPEELRLGHGQQVIILNGKVGPFDSSISYSPENNGDFVVEYDDKPGELWLQHGKQVITLSGQVNGVNYNPENNGDFVVEYEDKPGELWLQHGKQVITLSGQVDWVNYSPENNGDFVVDYRDVPGELRLGHGQQVITLSGQVNGVNYSPENNGDFVVGYTDTPGELRLGHGQQVINLNGQVDWRVYYSPENNGDFVVVYEDKPGELRVQHGQQVIILSGQVDLVYYSPENNGDFVVGYKDQTGELRLEHGQRAITLNGEVFWVDYSPEHNGDFVVGYKNFLDELWMQHGQQVITLNGMIWRRYYNPEKTNYPNWPANLWLENVQKVITFDREFHQADYTSHGIYFSVAYKDGTAEVWHGNQARLLTKLGLGTFYDTQRSYITSIRLIFDEPNDRLIVWYEDGRAYLLDLAMLSAIRPESSLEELKRVGCERLRRGAPWFHEAEVEPYLFGEKARGCGGN